MKNKAQELHATLFRKARESAAFRRELLANPKAALRSLGIPLPEGVELKVVEETASRWYLVLPTAGAGEIPDAQLDAVAGGVSYPTGLLGYAATLKAKPGTGAVGPCDMPKGAVGPCDRPRG